MKEIIKLIKKTENLSALSMRLVKLTGKAPVLIHPKHLIRKKGKVWYRGYLNKAVVVLDAGCGSGQHSIQIARYVKKIMGIDKDSRNLEIANISAKYHGIKNIFFKQADLEKKIDLKNDQFDLILLFDVLEHINRRQFFLKEIKRVLKKRGVVIISIPNLDTSWKRLQRKYGIRSYSDPDHKIEYTKDTITKEVTLAGLQVRKIAPISYDTPWVGFIDLIGGISLTFYKKLSNWKAYMLKKYPENCSGFIVEAIKQ